MRHDPIPQRKRQTLDAACNLDKGDGIRRIRQREGDRIKRIRQRGGDGGGIGESDIVRGDKRERLALYGLVRRRATCGADQIGVENSARKECGMTFRRPHSEMRTHPSKATAPRMLHVLRRRRPDLWHGGFAAHVARWSRGEGRWIVSRTASRIEQTPRCIKNIGGGAIRRHLH
jgi:hypothetical protein